MEDQLIQTKAAFALVFAPLWVPLTMNLLYWIFNL